MSSSLFLHDLYRDQQVTGQGCTLLSPGIRTTPALYPEVPVVLEQYLWQYFADLSELLFFLLVCVKGGATVTKLNSTTDSTKKVLAHTTDSSASKTHCGFFTYR